MQEFFDSLSERFVRDEPLLVQDTTQAELDYIAARAAEAALAREAGSAGYVEDEADAAAKEKELAQWAKSAGEASGANAEAPLVEDADDESSEEEVEVNDPPVAGRQRILRQASSGEPVRPGRIDQSSKKKKKEQGQKASNSPTSG